MEKFKARVLVGLGSTIVDAYVMMSEVVAVEPTLNVEDHSTRVHLRGGSTVIVAERVDDVMAKWAEVRAAMIAEATRGSEGGKDKPQ